MDVKFVDWTGFEEGICDLKGNKMAEDTRTKWGVEYLKKHKNGNFYRIVLFNKMTYAYNECGLRQQVVNKDDYDWVVNVALNDLLYTGISKEPYQIKQKEEEKKEMTNFDKIKNMDIEEFSDKIAYIFSMVDDCGICPAIGGLCNSKHEENPEIKCSSIIKEWLSKPVKEKEYFITVKYPFSMSNHEDILGQDAKIELEYGVKTSIGKIVETTERTLTCKTTREVFEKVEQLIKSNEIAAQIYSIKCK